MKSVNTPMCEQDISSYLSMFGGPLIFVLAVFGSAIGQASILKRLCSEEALPPFGAFLII